MVSENQHLGWPSNEHKLIHIIEVEIIPAYSLSTKMYSEQHAT
jgi:hypothetical protein